MSIIIDTPEGIAAYAKLQLYYALKLEVNTGLRHSRGSIAQLIRERNPSLTSRKKSKLLAEYGELLRSEGVLKS